MFPNGSTLDNGGQVLFVSTNITPLVRAIGYFGPDGRFDLTTFTEGDGAIASHYQVAVVPNIPDDRDDPIVSKREYAEAMDPIDDRFLVPGTSGIAFDVTAESSPHDFRIEVHKPRRRRR